MWKVIALCLSTFPSMLLAYYLGESKHILTTQPAIQTDIVSVRGCDIIQLVQGDKLITAFTAPDQPKSCKVQHQTTTSSKAKK